MATQRDSMVGDLFTAEREVERLIYLLADEAGVGGSVTVGSSCRPSQTFRVIALVDGRYARLERIA